MPLILGGGRLWFMLVSEACFGCLCCSDVRSPVTSQSWTPLDEKERAKTEYSINDVQTEALRKLVAESGAYVNEVLHSLHF